MLNNSANRWFAFFATIAAGCTGYPGRHVAEFDTVAIRQVSITNVDSGTVLRDHTIHVVDGVIRAISPDSLAVVPAGTPSIDGLGTFVIPGLADMHVHHYAPPHSDTGSPYEDDDLLLFLVNGVTTVRNMGGSERDLRARRRIQTGKVIGPHYYTCGAQLGKWTDVEEAEEKVLEQKKAGYDCLKLYSGLTKPAFHKIIETAARLRLPAVGHAQVALGLEETMKLQSIEHIEEILLFFKDGTLTDPANEAIAQKLAERRVYVTPTLGGVTLHEYISQPELNELLRRPDVAFVSEAWYDAVTERSEESFKNLRRYGYARLKKQSERAREVAGFFHKSHVRFLLGTDTLLLQAPGFAVHRELQTLVEVGLTPAEALQTATSNVANFLGPSHRGGRIEVGRNADLVLLDANPLIDIRNTRRIAGVMIGRRWITAPAIKQISRELRKR